MGRMLVPVEQDFPRVADVVVPLSLSDVEVWGH